MYRFATACLFLTAASLVVSGGVLEWALRRSAAMPGSAGSGPPRQLRITKFEYESCSVSDNPIVELGGIELPDPILIPGHNEMFLNLNVKEDIVSGLRVELRLSKKVLGLIGVPIPCIGNIGSCTYEDLCVTLSDFYAANGRCPANIPYDIVKCECPVEATEGFEDLRFSFSIDPDSIGSLLAWLASGEYEVKAEASMNGREVGCMQATINVSDN